GGTLGAQLSLQELAAAQDDREEVVEIMGHAARQLADGLHLPNLAELILHPLPLRDIGVDAERADDPALRVSQGHLACKQNGLLPVGPALGFRDVQERLAAPHDFPVAAYVEVGLLARERHVVVRLADDFRRGSLAQVTGQLLVTPEIPALQVLPEDGTWD